MDTDRNIQEYCQNGSYKQAFEEIVRAYSQRLYWHIRKIVLVHDDADDVLQNTLMKVWTGLPAFRWESQLFTWLYRIATNEVLTFIKKQSVHTNAAGRTVRSRCASVQRRPNPNGLAKAIERLPAKQRLVFNMRYFDEMRYEDMSAILGTSVGALKASYHHAYTKVQKTLKEMLL